MLSLAISSLGKQEGGWCRKIIWTFSLVMDPTPQRGVKGAGRGDSSGQYSGALGGSSSERGSWNHRGDLRRVVLLDRNFKVKCAECWGKWGGVGGHGRHQGAGGVWELLTVPARARYSHRCVQANDRRSAGIERCCRLVRRRCVSLHRPPRRRRHPQRPLLPTGSFLRHSEGMGRHTGLTPEVLSYWHSVPAWMHAW